MSWRPEVLADFTGKWCSNALRFATPEEADKSAKDLLMRWTAVRETRVVESGDPVNYQWDDNIGLIKLAPATPTPTPPYSGTPPSTGSTKVGPPR